MWRLALKALAAQDAGRRWGDYAKNLTARYLILGMALIAVLAAAGFAALAGFWALNAWTQSPMQASLIMMGLLLLAALLITLAAYGLTKEKPAGARPAPGEPLEGAQGGLPTPEDVGREIENAVRRFGPLPVAAAAVAGGFVAGILAKRFSQPPVVYEYEPRYRRRGRR